MSDAKLMSAVASRVAAGSDRVSPPALRMDTSLSSPTPPSTVWRASPCPHSPNVRVKSSAASACRSGVPERAAIRHSRNIVRRHITTIVQREPGFCQPKLHYRLPRHQLGGRSPARLLELPKTANQPQIVAGRNQLGSRSERFRGSGKPR
jgi:hypothetical protein